MKTIDYASFLDRVYGCWIGKCVSGTIGAPYEGYKGEMAVEYTPALFAVTLPNDDLDLQVLWLEAIEAVGPDVTSEDLARIFAEKCPYAPGEYATFKKNYKLGLLPPMTGRFNNNYYREGMGCPIRSEIWACLAPGNPTLAAALAQKDGCLDHAGESIIAEAFLAALEALCFTESRETLWTLFDAALAHIDTTSKFAGLVRDVMAWCKDETVDAWRMVTSKILRKYGHPDCTNLFQNMGITLMALLLGGGDFIQTTMLALNCGFDTDCTCATVGAVLGILIGGEALMRQYSIKEQVYKLSVNTSRRSDKVFDLATDTARAAVWFDEMHTECKLVSVPEGEKKQMPKREATPFGMGVRYDREDPSIAPGEEREVILTLTGKGRATLTPPVGFSVSPREISFDREAEVRVKVSCDADIPVLMQKNLISVEIEGEAGSMQTAFGMVGATLWRAYGPFWENTTYAPPPKAMESYGIWLGGKDADSSMDNLRQFHLNMTAQIGKNYLESRLVAGTWENGIDDPHAEEAMALGFDIALRGDVISVRDLAGNTMPSVWYLVTDLVAPRDMTVHLQIGHEDAFRFFLNGTLLTERGGHGNWTPENVHLQNVSLKEGCNRIVFKVKRENGEGRFSVMFTENGACSDFLSCLGSATVK